MIENKEVSQVLTEGLLAGFAGDGVIETVNRAGFEGKSSNFLTDRQDIYHDQWFVPSYVGGGQELISLDEGTQFTRLYGGGTPDPKILEDLGITVEDIGAYLIKMLTTLGNKTRLFEDYVGEVEGEWQYNYTILLIDHTIKVVSAAEEILYKGTRVHLHPFILSPVA